MAGDALPGYDTGVIGMLAVLRDAGCEPVPLFYASACPSGAVEAGAFDELKNELLECLADAGELGECCCACTVRGRRVNARSGGDLAGAVRDKAGEAMPIVCTLDLHAHVTFEMLEHMDALLAWETYPHEDAFETGDVALELLIEILAGRLKPVGGYVAKVPVLVSAIHGQTKPPGPFADLMQEAKRLEGERALFGEPDFGAPLPEHA